MKCEDGSVAPVPADEHLVSMHQAILILGPTASGKTPLGDELQRTGWQGRRCVHIDFGTEMRRILELDPPPPGFAPAELKTISTVLTEGRLLTDREFPLVEKIFALVAEEVSLAPDDLVIMNGVPRHAGQVRDIVALVEVVGVVVLEAEPAVIEERIRRDTGGDRAGRIDDLPEQVRARLARYEQWTRPLIEHYRRTGIPVTQVQVGIGTTASLAAASLTSDLTALSGPTDSH
jgi:adenylate kinase family enzyme